VILISVHLERSDPLPVKTTHSNHFTTNGSNVSF